MQVLTEFSSLKELSELDKLVLAAGDKDPIFFAEYILGIRLNPFQKRALLSLCENKQVMFVTANQVGKTVVLSVFHIWFNFYKKGISGEPELIDKAHFETLNISPVSRQSKEAFRYVEEILSSNWTWEEERKRFINKCRIGWFFEGKNEQMGRIDFSNNSSCFCLSTSEDQGAGFAGKQFALITYDECDQSMHLEEELPARIFSRTAKYSGPVVLCATPDEMAKSQQYWYHLYSEAKKGEGVWALVEGIYDDNIFIPEETREEYKKRLLTLDPEKYKQVILGQFISSADRMFSQEVIEGLWNGKRKPEKFSPLPDREYVLVADWGVADTGDETVMVVGDITNIDNIEVVWDYSKRGGDPIELMAMASLLTTEFNNSEMLLDDMDMGGTIFRKILERFSPTSFGKTNKPDALTYLKIRLTNNIRGGLTKGCESGTGRIKSYHIPKLESQLSCYKVEDKKLKQDWVIVMAMLCWFCDKYKRKEKIKVFNIQNFYKK